MVNPPPMIMFIFYWLPALFTISLAVLRLIMIIIIIINWKSLGKLAADKLT